MFNFRDGDAIEPGEETDHETFPVDEEFLAKVSELFNRVMYYKIDPATKFRHLEKAHKNYFKIVPRPSLRPMGLNFGIFAGPDSPYDDATSDDLCFAQSEQRALLFCLRAAANMPLVVHNYEMAGVDQGVKEGLDAVLGINLSQKL